MLRRNSRKNPIDLDAEVTVPTEPLNSQTILEDEDLVMREKAIVRRSPSSRDTRRAPKDGFIQKISASKSETDSDESDEIVVGRAPVAPVDYEPENDRVSQIKRYIPKDSNTLKIESDDMDVDTNSSPRGVSRESLEVIERFSSLKSKRRVNSSNPAHKPPHIVIEPDEQAERRILTRGRTGYNSNKSAPIVVKVSSSPEPKRPRFDGDDDELPTVDDIVSKRSEVTERSVSPPPTSGLKRGKAKEKEFVDPNMGLVCTLWIF